LTRGLTLTLDRLAGLDEPRPATEPTRKVRPGGLRLARQELLGGVAWLPDQHRVALDIGKRTQLLARTPNLPT
jgi:hypothetical protein